MGNIFVWQNVQNLFTKVQITEIVDTVNNGHEEEAITSRKTDDSVIAYPIIDNEVGPGEIAEVSNTIEIIRESQSIDADQPEDTVLKKSKKPKLLAHATTDDIEPNQKLKEEEIVQNVLTPETEEIKPNITRKVSKSTVEKIEVSEQNTDQVDLGTKRPKTARLLSKSSVENVEIAEEKVIIVEKAEASQNSKLLSKSKVELKESIESIKAEVNVDNGITIKTEFKRSDSEKSGVQIVELDEPTTPIITNQPSSTKPKVEDEDDEEMKELFNKIQKQRSVLEEIIGDKPKEEGKISKTLQ